MRKRGSIYYIALERLGCRPLCRTSRTTYCTPTTSVKLSTALQQSKQPRPTLCFVVAGPRVAYKVPRARLYVYPYASNTTLSAGRQGSVFYRKPAPSDVCAYADEPACCQCGRVLNLRSSLDGACRASFSFSYTPAFLSYCFARSCLSSASTANVSLSAFPFSLLQSAYFRFFPRISRQQTRAVTTSSCIQVRGEMCGG